MTVASDLNSYEEITAKLVAGRLFLFLCSETTGSTSGSKRI